MSRTHPLQDPVMDSMEGGGKSMEEEEIQIGGGEVGGREGEMGVGGKVERKEGIGGGEEGGRERWEWEGR